MIYIDKYSIQLIIGDHEYTTNDIRIDKIVIYESVQLSVPSVEILCGIPEVKLAQLVSSDVIKGKLIISRIENNQNITIVNMPIKYNSSEGNSNLETATTRILFDMDWDYGYLASTRALTSTSGEVFKTIGLESGFNTVITTSTSDLMTWINPNYRGIKFLNSVCEASWSSNSSCLQWGVRSDNSLIFRDINKNMSEKQINLILGNLNTAVGYGYRSCPVTLNRLYGYGRVCTDYNFKEGTIDTMGSITITPLGNKPTISAQGNQGSYRLPVDCGNTHDHYQRAIIQNLRIKSTFNTNIKLSIIQDNTNIQLLDDIVIVNHSQYYATINKMRGIITGRTIVLEKNKMNYIFSIDTNGFNTEEIL